MRTGFATPVRRPWFHRARATRRSRATIAIAGIVALSAFTTACADNSPVSAPTSTLPAPQPSESASSPSVPEYTTDLDLTDEEKEAVEGALVALEGYVATLNRVFSSGGADRTAMDEFAKGTALQTLNEDADDLQATNETVVGKFEIDKRSINEVRKDSTEVSILSCVDNAKFKRQQQGSTFSPTGVEPLTVEFVASSENDSWKITSQDLWSEECVG